MNRFRSQSTRTCLEDVSAPIRHFAACRQSHEFMYRQLAQVHRHEPQVDPDLWSRTAHVWSGNVSRARAGLVQLAAGFYGKCATTAILIMFVLGLQLLSAPLEQHTTPSKVPRESTYVSSRLPTAAENTAKETTDSSSYPANNLGTQHMSAAPASSQVALAVDIPQPVQDNVAPTPSNPPVQPSQPAPPAHTPVSPDGVTVNLFTDSNEPSAVDLSLAGIRIKAL